MSLESLQNLSLAPNTTPALLLQSHSDTNKTARFWGFAARTIEQERRNPKKANDVGKEAFKMGDLRTWKTGSRIEEKAEENCFMSYGGFSEGERRQRLRNIRVSTWVSVMFWLAVVGMAIWL